MEMTSCVMRFALATYLMKRGGTSRVCDESSWSSPCFSYERRIASSSTSDEECEDKEEILPDDVQQTEVKKTQ
ncbi:hypothetical protein P3T76_007059 [Phytophthora citrophthora]|uniref:Uncharacterized protein n=1 Tax=Phytophthora citrophthora TaxID=4793 RepID=A0AAD9GN70_9STRA|nr:hypothetical protein P3T76_007059 [Phytophthora citrophthora]